MNKSCFILIAHGSKKPEWAVPFQKLTDDLRKELGAEAVHLCFMENMHPTLLEVAPEIMKTSVRKCRLVPLFMAKGNHFRQDIPALIEEMKRSYPELETELLEPIGLHPLFFELMGTVIKSL
jgi:sirohydrochlorin cobaltochelatase